MRAKAIGLLAFALGPVLGACARQSPEEVPGVICTMEARSTFAVTVVDSISNARITQGVTVRVSEGAFTATLSPPPPGDSVFSGEVYERPGTYDVSVMHAGHQPWQQRVQVGSDPCHVITARITARLRPAS